MRGSVEAEKRRSGEALAEMGMMTHKDLDVWKMGLDIVEKIYRITERFPKEEQFGLTSQLRRSAVSIPSNIAEGAAASR